MEFYAHNIIREELENYLINNIRTVYENFDRAHDIRHFDEVFLSVLRCLKSGMINDVNPEIMLAAAAYHDVGCIINRDDHEINSVYILNKDKKMKEFFDEDEIAHISKIITHHRKSKYKDDDNNFDIYELLLRDADSISTYRRARALYRVVGFNIDNYKDEGWTKVFDRIKRRLSTRRFEWSPKTEVMKEMYKYPDIYTEWKDFEIITVMNHLWND